MASLIYSIKTEFDSDPKRGPNTTSVYTNALELAALALRRIFLIRYAQVFSSTQYSNVFDDCIAQLRMQVTELKNTHASDTPDGLALHAILNTANKLLTRNVSYALANCQESEFTKWLESKSIPCAIPRNVWFPFFMYYRYVGMVNNYAEIKLPTNHTTPATLWYPVYKDRVITLTEVKLNTRLMIDVTTDAISLKSEDVFGYLGCLDWTNSKLEDILVVLALSRIPSWERTIYTYIEDCLYYTGRSVDPCYERAYYHIDDRDATSLISLLLTVKAKTDIEFQSSALATRILFVDPTGILRRRLATAYPNLDIPFISSVGKNRSLENLAASAYITSEDTTDKPIDDEQTNQTSSETPKGDESTEDPNPESSADPSSTTPNERTPASDQYDDEEMDTEAGLLTLGNITIHESEAPSFQGTMIREQIKQQLDRILVLKPKNLTSDELQLLQIIRVRWLYLFNIPSVLSLLGLVLHKKTVSTNLQIAR